MVAVSEGGYAIWRLSVRKSADGRSLVYVAATLSGKTVTCAGELLPAGNDNIESVIYRVATRFELPDQVPQECVRELAAQGRKGNALGPCGRRDLGSSIGRRAIA